MCNKNLFGANLVVIKILCFRNNNLGKWTSGNNGSGTDFDANSGILEDYDEYSGGLKPSSSVDFIIMTSLTALLVCLFQV